MEQEPAVRAEDLQRQIQGLERRDLRLALLNLVVTLVLAAGLVGLVFPHVIAKLQEFRVIGPFFHGLLYALVALIFLVNVFSLLQIRSVSKARGELIGGLVRRDTTEKLSLVDPLTGIFNRRYLDEILPREVSRADRRDTSLSFVKLDVDDFRAVNTRLGAQVGDRVLQEVTQLLKRVFRPTDIVIRYGGDEFLVVMPETGKHGALTAVRRLLEKVDEWNRKNIIPGYEMGLGCGVADYIKGHDVTDALAAADHRVFLYRDGKSLDP